MKLANWIRSGQLWALAGIAVLAFGALTAGCNDHRFTPVAEMSVAPSVIDYDLQRSPEYNEQILLTNNSVSARLEIYEILFEDSTGSPLTEESEQVFDQTVALASLQETSNLTGNAITYAHYMNGIVSDVECEDDTYCNCDPNSLEAGETCNVAVEDGTVEKERMGKMFLCKVDPIHSTGKKVCVANYRFYNSAGETTLASWGGETTAECQDNSNCSRLGPGFSCSTELGKCVSDIKNTFALDYGLEQLVNVSEEAITNKDKAAVWTGLNGEPLCIQKAGSSTPEEATLYGLNRCDQIALKMDMHSIDDSDNAFGYKLYPTRQANYRLMLSPVDAGQSGSVVFCGGGAAITMQNVMLQDPIADESSCFDGDSVNSESLSVDVTKVKIDQLPVRVLYAPASDFQPAAVLTEKNFTMRIFSSASVGGSFERVVTLRLPENRGGPPTPIIEIPADQQDPEPLAVIHLDGRNSTSPFGEDRKPFQYFWAWAPGGRPQFAQDAVLIGSTDTFDNPRDIMGKWVNEGYPKIYFPIAGTYKIMMKVKDSAGVPSGPNDDCPTCEEWAQIDIKVKPSQKLHVELIWDRGDNVDLDLRLVRFRTDGTFGIGSGIIDALKPTPAVLPGCSSSADCFNGAFECNDQGFCVNSCTSDDDCKAADPGWYCNSFSMCEEKNKDYIECETDADCGSAAYCSPASVGIDGYKLICTKHRTDAVNDTCSDLNKNPRWGEYEDIITACSGDSACNGRNGGDFSCSDTCECEGQDCTSNEFACCNYACENSAQCLDVSYQYICDTELGECVGNNLENDPTLDIDDVNGWGPENISLKEPETGRYRVVARLYADPSDVVSNAGPLSPVRAYVQIYLNGELVISKGIAHELVDVMTYWKIADITWDSEAGISGDGTVEPICAGWTLTQCNNTEECSGWYGDDFQCSQRQWGKFCSTCIGGSGTPEECNPVGVPCTSNADCTSEATARTCAEIKGNYCTCPGSNEFADSSNDPYANPFVNQAGAIFDPLSSSKRSIWCDSAEATQFDGMDILSGGAACSSLYSGQ